MRRRHIGSILLAATLVSTVVAVSLPPAFSAGTWVTQTSPTSNHLHGVYAVDALNAHAVGHGGEVLRTTDGGANWTVQTTPPAVHLWDVHFPTAVIGYAVGDSGTIVKTIDSGASWAAQTSPTSDRFNAVFFADALTGFAVGDGGAVIATFDGGANWNTQTSNTGVNLYDVVFADALTGYAVGDGGEVIKTLDGGANWIVQTTPTAEALYGVSFLVDDLTGYAVGSAGVAIKTIDGGANWAIQPTPVGTSLTGVSFVNNLLGYSVGDSGGMLRTEDGGANWVVEVPPVSKNMDAVHFPSGGGGGWAVADTGTIFYRDPGAASGSCYLIGVPTQTELSVTDLSDVNPATNEATIGWASNSHVGPAAVQPGTGVLFAVEAPKLGTINTGTGDFTPFAGGISTQTGALGPQNVSDIRGLAFNPTDGTLFGVARRASSPDLLFQLDPITGDTVDDAFGAGIGYVEIVSDKAAQTDFYGLVIDSGGQMRAMGNDGNSQWKLHTVDKTDGAAVSVVNSSEVVDLSYDVAGTLWGITPDGTLFDVNGAETSRTVDNIAPYTALACVAGAGPANTNPVLGLIGNQAGPEGSPVGFDAAATDPDLPAQGLTFSLDATGPGHSLPVVYSWNPVTGVFSWTPSELEGGTSHTFVVVVTDDGVPVASDSEQITITSAEVNSDPVLGAVGNQSGPEGSSIGFDASATDSDLPTQTLTFSLDATALGHSLPAIYSWNPVTGVFSWTPSESEGGTSHTFVVVVTDDGVPVASDHEQITITSAEVNTAPTAVGVVDVTVDELVAFGFTASAFDPDVPVDVLSWSLVSGPSGSVVTSGGVFSWTPTEVQGPGSYPVTLRVFDGTDTDDVSFTITVDEVNVGPTADPIVDVTVDELVAFGFTASAFDPDVPVDVLSWSLVSGPSGSVVTSGGVFSWTPTEVQGPGSYPVTLRVFDGTDTDDVSFTITVDEVNVGPTADPIVDVTVDELVAFGFTASAFDPDVPVDVLSWSLVSGPSGSVVTSGGVFSWTPTEVQGPGSYPVTLRVFDGTDTDDVSFTITVDEVNVGPTADPIVDVTVDELVAFGFTASAFDPDVPVDVLSWSLVSGPSGSVVTSGGVFSWTPTEVQGPGSYPVTLRVFDGTDTDDVSFTITVDEVNVGPTADPIVDVTVDELVAFGFTASAFDPDVPVDVLSWSLVSGPSGSVVTSGGVFSWTPTEVQGPGSYPVTLRVFDGTDTDDVSFTITVDEVNRTPVFDTDLLDRTDAEGTLVSLPTAATDPDLDDLGYSATGLPPGLTIDPTSGMVSGVIDFTAAAGSPYAVVILVTDDGVPNLDASDAFSWTVTNTNRDPDAIHDAATTGEDGPGVLVDVLANDADPDLDVLSLVAHDPVSAMGGAVSTEGGSLRYVPAEDFAGSDSFAYTVSDGNGGTAIGTVTVTVVGVDDLPVIVPPTGKTVEHGAPLTFVVGGSDIDTPAASLTFTLGPGSPPGATLSGSGAFAWTPGLEQLGTHPITVELSDGTSTVSATFFVSVLAPSVALPPTPDLPLSITPISTLQIAEGTELALTVVAADPDDPDAAVTFSLVTSPAGATIDPATGVFIWTPSEAQGPGEFTVAVRALDASSGQSAVAEFQVIVAEVNALPVVIPIADQSIEPDSGLRLGVSAADSDEPGGSLRFSLIGTPPDGAAIGAATGVITWTPAPGQPIGAYTFVVAVTDGASTVEERFVVRVLPAGSIDRRNLLVARALDISDEGVAGTGSSDAGIQRTLVLMGQAASFTVGALRMPFLAIVGLLLLLATVGRISLFPAFTRGDFQTGRVVWYDRARGFGYIRPDSGEKNAFIHSSAVRRWQRGWFEAGASVRFKVVSSPHRDFARRVRRGPSDD